MAALWLWPDWRIIAAFSPTLLSIFGWRRIKTACVSAQTWGQNKTSAWSFDLLTASYQLSCSSEKIAGMVFEQEMKRSGGLRTLLRDGENIKALFGSTPKPACCHGIWIRRHTILTSFQSETYILTWLRLFNLASSGLIEAVHKGGVWVVQGQILTLRLH